MRKRTLGRIACCVALLLLCAMLLPGVHQFRDATHACSGTDCPTCACLNEYASSARALACALLAFGFLLADFFLRALTPAPTLARTFCKITLIDAKIRMND